MSSVPEPEHFTEISPITQAQPPVVVPRNVDALAGAEQTPEQERDEWKRLAEDLGKDCSHYVIRIMMLKAEKKALELALGRSPGRPHRLTFAFDVRRGEMHALHQYVPHVFHSYRLGVKFVVDPTPELDGPVIDGPLARRDLACLQAHGVLTLNDRATDLQLHDEVLAVGSRPLKYCFSPYGPIEARLSVSGEIPELAYRWKVYAWLDGFYELDFDTLFRRRT